MRFFRVLSVFLLAVCLPAQQGITPERGEELFAEIDSMLESIAGITGLAVREPIPRALLTKQEIRELVETRLKEETTPDEVRQEELFLKLFGFVGDDFDLEKQFVDVMTEQATALYDFKTRKLYLATWTPPEMQEFALVHELAHAVADQHFSLRKFVKKAKDSEQDVARSAVMEGQASWIMTEHVMRQGGRSMLENRILAVAAAAASRIEAADYPVFSNAPDYVQESLIFPYTKGLLFQQSVLEKFGKQGFARVFENPPLSTQHILEPETYFSGREPSKVTLPEFDRPRGYKKILKGQLGQLDLWILVKQYFGRDRADALGPHWRGGAFEIWEDAARPEAVLRYAVEWAEQEAAEEFFSLYQEICRKKWSGVEQEQAEPAEWKGTSNRGGFRLLRTGAVVAAVEGIPEGDGKLKETRLLRPKVPNAE